MLHRIGVGTILAGMVVAVGCHRPMGKIESLRDALVEGDRDGASRAIEVGECPEAPKEANAASCLDGAARAFGAPTFSSTHPDQASAAAAAYLLVRRREGAGIPAADTWLEAIATSPGPGADALRLALASAMKEVVPRVGKHVDDEPAARGLLDAVAHAVPGACEAYAALGRGDPITSFSPAASPDHAPCVQHDLERKDGPGPAYGDGLWRAAAGGAALWKEASHALTLGIGITDGGVRRTLRRDLDVIEASTRELAVRTVTTTQTGQYGAASTHQPGGALSGRDGGVAPSPGLPPRPPHLDGPEVGR
jgi:hypothetical protein